jgi:hypothetical protein
MVLKLIINKSKYLLIFLFFNIIIVGYCSSQNMPPKIQAKLDSIYPKFLYLGGNVFIRNNKSNKEVVLINCNCKEYGSEMEITLDTNANILSKEYELYKFGNLPKSILKYIKRNTTQEVRFDSLGTSKIVYTKGKTQYSLLMRENDHSYIIILDKNGKFISKKILMPMKE